MFRNTKTYWWKVLIYTSHCITFFVYFLDGNGPGSNDHLESKHLQGDHDLIAGDALGHAPAPHDGRCPACGYVASWRGLLLASC